MPTLLHISDLHRTSDPRLSNPELLAAILSDANRWNLEGISGPDLIVVSGDLIQGAGLDVTDPDELINSQYQEAGDFLNRLGEELVDSDRSRIVIVPGNHDVNWRRSLDAMNRLCSTQNNVSNKYLVASSGIRWSWADQHAYEITDQHVYASRFDHFREFQKSFYEGVEPNPLVSEERGLFFREYPDLDLLVVGFPSWYGNDCFCHVGEIEPATLEISQKLVANSKMNTAVAVWHHSISGGPRSHDYMDQHTVHRLVDFGFEIGLHGHQHFPEAAPFELHLPNMTSMIVAGAGSLAVGDSELPMGEPRQFNIVIIDPDHNSVKIHVRGMSPAGVFTGVHRNDFGGKTFIELKLPPKRVRGGSLTVKQKLDDMMTAIGNKQFKRALELSDELPVSRSMEKRRIEIEVLRGLGETAKLVKLLDPPQNVTEVVELTDLLIKEFRYDDALDRLLISESIVPVSILEELRQRISTSKRMSK